MPQTLHPPRVRPRSFELLLPAVAVALSIALPLLDRAALPDPMAVHWGFDGRPDGSAPLLVHVMLMSVLTALLSSLPLVGAGASPRGTARQLVGLSHGAATLLALVNLFTLRANRGAADWTQAAPLRPLELLGMVGLALLAGLVGWGLAAWRPERPVRKRTVVPAAMAQDGEVLIWVGRQALAHGQLAGPFVLLLAVVLTPFLAREVTLVVTPTLALLGCMLWGLTSVRVSVGPTGLRAGFGPLGWPRLHVALAEVTSVSVEDVVPMVYGGWGYRVVPGVRAIVIRGGEGLRVGRRGRSDLVITVDDAEVAAGVLAAHVAAA
jgi:hypothetical protein